MSQNTNTNNPLLSLEGSLQSAMKLKQAQMDRDRARFLQCTRAMQNSLFHGLYGGRGGGGGGGENKIESMKNKVTTSTSATTISSGIERASSASSFLDSSLAQIASDIDELKYFLEVEINGNGRKTSTDTQPTSTEKKGEDAHAKKKRGNSTSNTTADSTTAATTAGGDAIDTFEVENDVDADDAEEEINIQKLQQQTEMAEKLKLLMALHLTEKKLRVGRGVGVEGGGKREGQKARGGGTDEEEHGKTRSMKSSSSSSLPPTTSLSSHLLRLKFMRMCVKSAGDCIRKRATLLASPLPPPDQSSSSPASLLTLAIDLLESGYATMGFLVPLKEEEGRHEETKNKKATRSGGGGGIDAIKDDAVAFYPVGKSVAELFNVATPHRHSGRKGDEGGVEELCSSALSPQTSTVSSSSSSVPLTSSSSSSSLSSSRVAAHALLVALGSTLSKEENKERGENEVERILGLLDDKGVGEEGVESDLSSASVSLLLAYAQLGAFSDLCCNLAICYGKENGGEEATNSSLSASLSQPLIRDEEAEEVLEELLSFSPPSSSSSSSSASAAGASSSRVDDDDDDDDDDDGVHVASLSSLSSNSLFKTQVARWIAAALVTGSCPLLARSEERKRDGGSTAAVTSTRPPPAVVAVVISPHHLRASYLLAKGLGTSANSTTRDAERAIELLGGGGFGVGGGTRRDGDGGCAPPPSFSNCWGRLFSENSDGDGRGVRSSNDEGGSTKGRTTASFDADSFVELVKTEMLRLCQQEKEADEAAANKKQARQLYQSDDGKLSPPSSSPSPPLPPHHLLRLLPFLSSTLKQCVSQYKECITLRQSLQTELAANAAKLKARFALEAARQKKLCQEQQEKEKEKEEKEKMMKRDVGERDEKNMDEGENNNGNGGGTASLPSSSSSSPPPSSSMPTSSPSPSSLSPPQAAQQQRREAMELNLRHIIQRGRKDLVTMVYSDLFQPPLQSPQSLSSSHNGDVDGESQRRVLRYQPFAQQPLPHRRAYISKAMRPLLKARRQLLDVLCRRLFSSVMLPLRCFRVQPFAITNACSSSASSSSSSLSPPTIKEAYTAWVTREFICTADKNNVPNEPSCSSSPSASPSASPSPSSSSVSSLPHLLPTSSPFRTDNLIKVLQSATSMGLNLIGPLDGREEDEEETEKEEKENGKEEDDGDDENEAEFYEFLFCDAVASISNPSLFSQRDHEFLWESWEVRRKLRQIIFNYQFPKESLAERIRRHEEQTTKTSPTTTTSMKTARRLLPNRFSLMLSGRSGEASSLPLSSSSSASENANPTTPPPPMSPSDEEMLTSQYYFMQQSLFSASSSSSASKTDCSPSSSPPSSSTSSSTLSNLTSIARGILSPFLGSDRHMHSVLTAASAARERKKEVKRESNSSL